MSDFQYFSFMTSDAFSLWEKGALWSVLGVAVALRMEGEVCREARIVLGAVASQPREAVEAERLLAGERLTPELIDRVAEVAARPSKPLDNTDLVYYYRKRMTRVYVARALRELAGLPVGDWPTAMAGRNHANDEEAR